MKAMSRALGRYELLRPLARGGMAEVYLARRRAAGVEKLLVVKRMRPDRVGDPRFLDLFVREARLSMSLAHQNIVPVFDFGRIDDQVFIAMERVEGKDLGSSLARATRQHPLPPMLAAFVAAECCQALDYAHHRRGPDGMPLGIVHRDVTPRNVLLSWSGEVKLTDFGIAALAGDDPSKVIGTFAYMAPEQARGEATDPRADVYAVGLVLREAVTGTRARPGDDRDAMLAAARRGELLPWPDGGESPLRAIVDRATAADRDARYPSARSMLEALDAFIVDERSAKKSDAPARQLAGWLGELWKEEREERVLDEGIEGSHLVSFLDDGGIDVIGTGTVRSMAGTAADDAEVAKIEPTPATNVAKSRRSSWIAQGALAATIVGGGIVVAASVGERRDSPPVTRQALLPPQRPQAPDQPQTPKESPQPLPPPHIDQSIPISGKALQLQRAPQPRVQVRVGKSSPIPVPVVDLHLVTINSTPWSNWTIDDDPTPHQALDTVKLARGTHRIHYTGNPSFRVDKIITIEVPDNDGLRHSERLE